MSDRSSPPRRRPESPAGREARAGLSGRATRPPSIRRNGGWPSPPQTDDNAGLNGHSTNDVPDEGAPQGLFAAFRDRVEQRFPSDLERIRGYLRMPSVSATGQVIREVAHAT